MCVALRSFRCLRGSVISLQSAWRGFKCRKWYCQLLRGIIILQAHVRGNAVRCRYHNLKEKRLRHEERRKEKASIVEVLSIQSNDEAFLSKESSQEDLDDRLSADKDIIDSEGSSGIQEDSEAEPINFKPSIMSPASHSDFRFKQFVRTTETKKPAISLDVIHLRKKISFKRNKSAKTENQILDEKRSGIRKGSSSDSLISERSLESQYSSDSPIGNVTFENTHEKVRRQLHAINLNKISERRESTGLTSSAHSDGEVEEGISRSAPPVVSTTTAYSQFTTQQSDVWQRREETVKSSVRGPTLVSDKLLDPVHKPVRRESRSVSAELNSDIIINRPRPVLKSSISHDPCPEFKESEVPVRIERRRGPRANVCRSAGEDLSGNLVVGLPELGPIKESPTVTDGGKRTVRELRHEPHSSESSSWSPDIDVYRQAGVPVHGVPTKRNRSGAITTLDLRRRNSDPATKSLNLVMEQPSGDSTPNKPSDTLEWKGNLFTIAGHTFRKVTKFSKEDRCVYCSEAVDAIVTQGHKCVDCKKLFHPKCIQNGGVLEMPCQPPGLISNKPSRRKNRKHSRTPYDMNKPKLPVGGKFSLTKTSEFTDSTDKIISDAAELQQMQDFITQKIFKIESGEGGKPSEVDRVFKEALREFKDNLVATYSVANKQGDKAFNIKYKDLIANFLHIMQTVCNKENTKEDFPVTMGVNAFRGFMNEFMSINHLEDKPNKAKRKKEKKRKVEDPIIFAGHTFLLTIINIPTACEICTSFFMWPIERGLVCQNCKLTCHKKCYTRVNLACGKEGQSDQGNNEGLRVFGVPLHQLALGDGKVPVVVDCLITTIEIHGLYTEGIYRKSGVSSKVKELKSRIEEESVDYVNFGSYHVHVLAAVLKCFLREMPEPLLTFDCYEDFLRAANLTDPQDRVSTLFAILKKLPKPNFDLMERLIFHLARVASHEEANRMNAASLAIVFAPCILRTNKPVPAQDSLHDIGRQTQCVETIISEQLRKVKSTLADIDTLDSACHTATHRLSSLRSSKIFSPEELLPPELTNAKTTADEEEAILMGHIEEIQKEKALLTSALPSLTRTTSDDDLLSTDMDDGSLDDVTGNLHEDVTHFPHRRMRNRAQNVTRSVSGTEEEVTIRKLKRQSSSDNSVISSYPLPEPDCDEDPIMV